MLYQYLRRSTQTGKRNALSNKGNKRVMWGTRVAFGSMVFRADAGSDLKRSAKAVPGMARTLYLQ
jgi:hypothetical protein